MRLKKQPVLDWIQLGEIEVTGADTRVVIGPFSIEENDDAIWVQTEQTSPVGPWPWSFGILSWETDFGRELGSAKAYTESVGEVIRLGVGRAPRERRGILVYEPRSYNLGWIKKGNSLTLSFSAISGVTSGGGDPSFASSGLAFPVVDGRWKYAATGLLQLEL